MSTFSRATGPGRIARKGCPPQTHRTDTRQTASRSSS